MTIVLGPSSHNVILLGLVGAFIFHGKGHSESTAKVSGHAKHEKRLFLKINYANRVERGPEIMGAMIDVGSEVTK